MYQSLNDYVESLIYVPTQGMVHPGLSAGWVLLVVAMMIAISARILIFYSRYTLSQNSTSIGYSIARLPYVGGYLHTLTTSRWLLLGFRLLFAAIFLLVIYAGLFGTPYPERNIATVLTWTVWWSGVVISVFIAGSAWCAVCPWDALASWLGRRKIWGRGSELHSLNLKVPKLFRSVWPALFMFIALTWLELGMGVTTSPYATAVLALIMVVLATISIIVYERKAFCRYFCAVGRTIGAYSAMSVVALRPKHDATCAECKTLECYHGTDSVEPCPTHLVMGRISQNTYCTSCGACVMSCPHDNINWKIQGTASEILQSNKQGQFRVKADEAWFILGLVALTLFHGFTMMPYWEGWMQKLAYVIGDSGQLLFSFSISMSVAIFAPVLLYLLVIKLSMTLSNAIENNREEFKRLFSGLALSLLPLAFTYHIAHNLTHLVREGHGFWSVLANPLGTGTDPLSMHEIHMRHMSPLISVDLVFVFQALLVISGFWLGLRIAVQRLQLLSSEHKISVRAMLPIMLFVSTISLLNLWLLMQPMVMRM